MLALNKKISELETKLLLMTKENTALKEEKEAASANAANG